LTPRLLQAIAGARHGGAETFFVRLAGALQRAGTCQLALIRRHKDRAQSLRELGVPVVELGFGGVFDLATRYRLRRAIRRWRPDIVLSWMNRATSFCPRGGFVHVGRLGGYYDLKYYRHCHYLVANTKAIAAWAVAAGWPAERVEYLPNFVPDLRPAPMSAAPAAAGCGLRALALGRLHPKKGFELLIEALPLLPGVDLWIAGDGPLRAGLEHLARRLGVAGRVAFLGWRDDVPELMAGADLLVCPSLEEPLGNVVIEAWSAGLPVVATRTAGPAALIRDGESGILVPLPGEGGGPAALAAAIGRLAADAALRRRLAASGRRAWEAEFTEERVVARYRGFFARIMPRCAASPGS
jgi:glycosyltransferase involved in cell wall biosynthesis